MRKFGPVCRPLNADRTADGVNRRLKKSVRKDNMEFLKEIFGDKALTYADLEAALKDNEKVKLGNLAGGAYVGKEKFDAKEKELLSANDLIQQLKESNSGNEELQSKVAEYEKQITALNQQLETERLEGALKTALIQAKATDVDYLAYKLKEKGEIKLDDSGKIAGIDDVISSLKTELPSFFEQDSKKNILEKKLDKGNAIEEGITKEAFERMGYQERNKLQREDPDTYAELTGKKE